MYNSLHNLNVLVHSTELPKIKTVIKEHGNSLYWVLKFKLKHIHICKHIYSDPQQELSQSTNLTSTVSKLPRRGDRLINMNLESGYLIETPMNTQLKMRHSSCFFKGWIFRNVTTKFLAVSVSPTGNYGGISKIWCTSKFNKHRKPLDNFHLIRMNCID